MNLVKSGASALWSGGKCVLGTFLRYVPFRFLAGAAFVDACQNPERTARIYTSVSQTFKDIASSTPCSKAIEGISALSAKIKWEYKATALGAALAYDSLASSNTALYAVGGLAAWGLYNPESAQKAVVAVARSFIDNPCYTASAIVGVASLLAAKAGYRYVLDKLSPDSEQKKEPADSKQDPENIQKISK